MRNAECQRSERVKLSPDIDESELFLSVLQAETEAERDHILQTVCAGNESLRARINDLIRYHDDSSDFLERPAPQLFDFTSKAFTSKVKACQPLPIGTQLGRWIIDEQIGEGGMGVVYRAHHVSVPAKVAALKIIKPGLETQSILARFEIERDSLARMDHPGLAKLFDVDVTPDGQPFIAMELVSGVPIDRFCSANQQTFTERIQLLIKVCEAVSHAHAKGIIHRDLKPSHLIVEPNKTEDVVHVIDFGISKLLYSGSPNSDRITSQGQLLGTLRYMSPEQTGHDDQIGDVRSDIYSLGVVLYELITNQHPTEQNRSEPTSLAEQLRRICEVIPTSPSRTTFFTANAPAWNRAKARRLDAIVVKAISKSPEQRYQSVAEFSDDLRRFLKDEIVLATTPSRREQLGYFCRRFRRELVFATTLFALLLIACVISLSLANNAWRAEANAKLEAQRATDAEALAQQRLLESEKSRRDAQLATTRSQRIRNLLFDLLRTPNATQTQSPDWILQVLQHSAKESIGADDLDTRLRMEILTVVSEQMYLLGDIKTAESLLQQAKELLDRLDEDEAELRFDVELMTLRIHSLNTKDDRHDLSHIRSLSKQLKETFPDRVDKWLAAKRIEMDFLKQQGQADLAYQLGLSIVDDHHQVFGASSWETIQFEAKLDSLLVDQQAYEKAIVELQDLQKRLTLLDAQHHPLYLQVTGNLAVALLHSGEVERASEAFEQLVAVHEIVFGPNHPTTLTSKLNLASSYQQLGRLTDCLELSSQIRAASQAKLGENHLISVQAKTLHIVALFESNQYHEGMTSLQQLLAETASFEHLQGSIKKAISIGARYAMLRGDFAEAIHLADTANEMAQPSEQTVDPEHLDRLQILTISHLQLKHQYQAVLAAIEFANGSDENSSLQSHNLLGLALLSAGFADRACSSLGKVWHQTDALPQSALTNKLSAASNYVAALHAAGRQEQALMIVNQVLTMLTQAEQQNSLTWNQWSTLKVGILACLDEHEQVVKLGNEVLRVVTVTSDTKTSRQTLLARLNTSLAESYLAVGNFHLAFIHSETAIELFENVKAPEDHQVLPRIIAIESAAAVSFASLRSHLQAAETWAIQRAADPLRHGLPISHRGQDLVISISNEVQIHLANEDRDLLDRTSFDWQQFATSHRQATQIFQQQIDDALTSSFISR